MIAYITITFENPVEHGTTDVGALHIKHPSGRSWILDTYKSSIGEDGKSLDLLASEDYDTFPKDDEYKYDLTIKDLVSSELAATLFVSSEVGNVVKAITYQVEDGMGNAFTEILTAEQEV